MNRKLILYLGISIIIGVLLLVGLNYHIGTPSFKSSCDNIYGENSWSEYGADYIDFNDNSDHPIYFNGGHIYTCFEKEYMTSQSVEKEKMNFSCAVGKNYSERIKCIEE